MSVSCWSCGSFKRETACLHPAFRSSARSWRRLEAVCVQEAVRRRGQGGRRGWWWRRGGWSACGGVGGALAGARWSCLQGQAGGSARWPLSAFPAGASKLARDDRSLLALPTNAWILVELLRPPLRIHTLCLRLLLLFVVCACLCPPSLAPPGSLRLMTWRSLFRSSSPPTSPSPASSTPASPGPASPRFSHHSPRASADFDDDTYSAMDSVISYLRIPLLASTGIATVLSGVLYFKQKCASCPPRAQCAHATRDRELTSHTQ